MKKLSARELFEKYSAAVAYVSVRKRNGEEGIGTCFHVGNGVMVTAKHVVEGNQILEVKSTVGFHGAHFLKMKVEKGPFLHHSTEVDVAAFVVDKPLPVSINVSEFYDDFIMDDDFLLREVLVMGYPPVPFSGEPRIVVSKGEINSIIDTYDTKHPYFIISATARGGFSGGICLIEWDFPIGLVTSSFVTNDAPAELGFMAVLTMERIAECLEQHKLIEGLNEMWPGLLVATKE